MSETLPSQPPPEPRQESFTCLACQVGFVTPEHQRNHYQTEWHRYNLKRKVAQLPPISSDLFAQRMLWIQNEEENKSKDIDYCYTCTYCQKTFTNEHTHSNHLQSKKHREAVKRGEHTLPSNEVLSTSDANNSHTVPLSKLTDLLKRKRKPVERKNVNTLPETESTASPSLAWDLTQCYFCKDKGATLEDNLEHMTSQHSFFIPEIDSLIDLPGLLTYLGEKVSIGHACLWCNTYDSTTGLFETLNDVRRHMIDKSHCQMYMDEEAIEYAEFYDFNAMWESEDETELHETSDEEPFKEMEVDEAMQLVLPNGKALGHRQLKTYYKQNPLHQMQVVMATPTVPSSVKPLLPIPTPVMQRLRAEWVRLGTKANKFQPHFRQQVMY
ncbi:hypothetical protein HMI56_004239 [Coelomomyces lativittatus]|nr:hypothetical protein HMI56_004239 [Coelomomyces lativittatus]